MPRPKSATRLSYAAIAAAFAINCPGNFSHSNSWVQWKKDLLAVADVLGNGNDKFNRQRFLRAAGAL